MASSSISINRDENNDIPIPILGLGDNYTLQHSRVQDFSSFISSSYSSSNYINIGTTQDGNAWANDSLKVNISYQFGEYDKWLENKPMIIMELLDQTVKNNHNRRYNKPKWVHPVNVNGSLNRVNSSYGGGDPSNLVTEWDFIPAFAFDDQQIEIKPQALYFNTSINLPQRWVDFVTTNGNQLRWQRSAYMTPTGNAGEYVVNTFKQPIRFRFGMIAEDGRSVILGEPSEQLFIQPKWGHFSPDDDTYVYDWKITFNH